MIFSNPYILSALSIFVFMLIMFGIAQMLRNNSIVDVGWGIGFIIVAYVTFYLEPGIEFQHELISFIITIWGVRLAGYIFIRNWGSGEDYRYVAMRKAWGNSPMLGAFFQVFMLQGLLMFLVSLPIIVINSSQSINPQLNFLHGIGALIWLGGFAFEAIGDAQMYLFRTDPHHKGRIMRYGLWKFTRHPNYFGEVTQWWAIFLIAIPSGLWYVSLVSPVVITYLILKVSGITMLERKYEDNEEYAEYQRTTSAFFPWIPKKFSEKFLHSH